MSSVICGPYSTTESLITPWLCSTKVAKTSPRHLKQPTTMNNLELRPERCIVLIHGTLVWEMSLSITPVQRQLLFFSWGCLIYKKTKTNRLLKSKMPQTFPLRSQALIKTKPTISSQTDDVFGPSPSPLTREITWATLAHLMALFRTHLGTSHR